MDANLESEAGRFSSYCSRRDRYERNHPGLAWNFQAVANIAWDNGQCSHLKSIPISGLTGGLCNYHYDGSRWTEGMVIIGDHLITVAAETAAGDDAAAGAMTKAIDDVRITLSTS